MKNYHQTMIRQLAMHVICSEVDDYSHKLATFVEEGDLGTEDEIKAEVKQYLIDHQAFGSVDY